MAVAAVEGGAEGRGTHEQASQPLASCRHTITASSLQRQRRTGAQMSAAGLEVEGLAVCVAMREVVVVRAVAAAAVVAVGSVGGRVLIRRHAQKVQPAASVRHTMVASSLHEHTRGSGHRATVAVGFSRVLDVAAVALGVVAEGDCAAVSVALMVVLGAVEGEEERVVSSPVGGYGLQTQYEQPSESVRQTT